jgi:hypothetical protein
MKKEQNSDELIIPALRVSDLKQRAINWFNSLDPEFRNKLIKEKRPARASYVDKGIINLSNNEIIELYSKHCI